MPVDLIVDIMTAKKPRGEAFAYDIAIVSTFAQGFAEILKRLVANAPAIAEAWENVDSAHIDWRIEGLAIERNNGDMVFLARITDLGKQGPGKERKKLS